MCFNVVLWWGLEDPPPGKKLSLLHDWQPWYSVWFTSKLEVPNFHGGIHVVPHFQKNIAPWTSRWTSHQTSSGKHISSNIWYDIMVSLAYY
jgi:hypothetical protein